MKKLFIAALVLISLSFCTKEYSREDLKAPVSYATTWAGTASNQALTKTALLDGYNNVGYILYVYASPMNASLQLVRKDSLIASSNTALNTDYPPFSVKSSNQIVVKSDITFKIAMSTSTNVSSCTGYSGTQTLYTDVSFTRFYTDASLTTPFVGNGNYYTWSLWGASIAINSSGYSTSVIFC